MGKNIRPREKIRLHVQQCLADFRSLKGTNVKDDFYIRVNIDGLSIDKGTIIHVLDTTYKDSKWFGVVVADNSSVVIPSLRSMDYDNAYELVHRVGPSKSKRPVVLIGQLAVPARDLLCNRQGFQNGQKSYIEDTKDFIVYSNEAGETNLPGLKNEICVYLKTTNDAFLKKVWKYHLHQNVASTLHSYSSAEEASSFGSSSSN